MEKRNPSQDGKGHENGNGNFFFWRKIPKEAANMLQRDNFEGLFPYSALLRLGNSMTPARCKDVKLAGAYRQESIQ